jgi:REP element-mobilizing transposase RayT
VHKLRYHIVWIPKYRKIGEEFLELEEFLWGDSFWAEGYFAESVGVAEEEMIRRYIRDNECMNYAEQLTFLETTPFRACVAHC